MRIVADPDRCVGAGQCVLTDPLAFDQREEDGTVLLLRARPPDGPALELARRAVHLCPGGALSLAE